MSPNQLAAAVADYSKLYLFAVSMTIVLVATAIFVLPMVVARLCFWQKSSRLSQS